MEYRIRKTGELCVACQKSFGPGDELYSMVLLESEQPERRDLCPACFDAREQRPEQEFAYWRTRRTGEAKQRRAVDFNTLREFFFRMSGQEGSEYRKLTYLLGLILIRKRFIRLDGMVSEDGRDFMVVTSKVRPEPLRIEAPELATSEFGELTDRLKILLDMDFEPELESGTAPAVSAAGAHGEQGAASEPPREASG